jgi:hypothetical protein
LGQASWPTPAARDTRSESCSDEFALKRNAETRGKPLTWAVTAGLPAPARRNTTGSRPESLPAQDGASWPTPRDQDSYERTNWKTVVKVNEEGGDLTLPRKVLYDAATDKTRQPVVLNPRWVACLMGFPPDYLDGVEPPSKR